MVRKELNDWDWPETGPCDKCGRTGRYVGGYVAEDGDGVHEVLNFTCSACDDGTDALLAEACLARKH